MPSSSYEYTHPTVQGPNCSYASLYSYNQNVLGQNRFTGPNIAQSRNPNILVVPSFGGNAYGALNNGLAQAPGGVPVCGGYLGLQNAYPNFPNGCGAFSSNLCG